MVFNVLTLRGSWARNSSEVFPQKRISAIFLLTKKSHTTNYVVSFVVDSESWLRRQNWALRTQVTWGFTCGKWIIAYNFGIDDGAESKFGTHKDLIVLNILKYKYCVN